jgi:hypothetical protein
MDEPSVFYSEAKRSPQKHLKQCIERSCSGILSKNVLGRKCLSKDNRSRKKLVLLRKYFTLENARISVNTGLRSHRLCAYMHVFRWRKQGLRRTVAMLLIQVSKQHTFLHSTGAPCKTGRFQQNRQQQPKVRAKEAQARGGSSPSNCWFPVGCSGF